MEITINAILGVSATLLTAIITRSSWPSTYKRAAALAMYAAMTVGVLLSQAYPAAWETIAAWLAMIAGAGQIAYTALKPTGLLDWIEEFTTPAHRDE